MQLQLQFSLLLLTSLLPLTFSLNSEGLSLLSLKAAISVDPTGILNSWSDSLHETPCSWPGVVCTGDRVTQLALPAKGLAGYIPSELSQLTELKRLCLRHNNFSSKIPSTLFTNTTNLMVLDLSHNSLSGSFPKELTSLNNLMHLDLSSNNLTGSLPDSFSGLISLTGTLNLSYNGFSGGIPVSLGEIPVAVSLDLRGNNFTGEIPQVGSLLTQGPTAFSGNPELCGFPLQNACSRESRDPVPTWIPPNVNPIPNQKPRALQTRGGEGDREEKERGGTLFVVFGLVSFVLVMGAVVLVAARRIRRPAGEFVKGKFDNEAGLGEEEEEKGKFVVVDEEEGFGGLELEDLLRGSAYVVGKSRSGIVYKVVGVGKVSFAAATVVAVRRLSEGDAVLRLKEFESEVEAIGRVRHPNVVNLKAYYYANDEKLLITDFIRNGSLHTALHGGPSTSLAPLSWAARLKIAQGSARGLMYIHEFNGKKYVHGNLKSTKILLDDDFHPCISAFGLTRLGVGTSKSTTLAPKRQNSNQSIVTSAMCSKHVTSSNKYLAPEVCIVGGKLTQKCDVYSFGIVLLELLTGRLPDLGPENDGKQLESFVREAFKEEQPLSEIIDPALLPEVHAKKQVIAAFHVALNCTEHDPELRQKMRTVSESLDRIKTE